MDLFAQLELKLEDLVEGVFSRAFKAPLHPIEVAKRLVRTMESNRSVSINNTYIPNVYTIFLSSKVYSEFTAMRDQLLLELEQYLRDFASERQYQTIGAMAVLLAEDAKLKRTETHIIASSDAQALPSGKMPPPPLKAPDEQMSALASAPAVALEVLNGEESGRRIQLEDGLTIGRGATNSLSLSSRGVSRQHADIVQQGNQWVIRDLGSTNGIYVNRKKVNTHLLSPGDMIAIGDALLQAF